MDATIKATPTDAIIRLANGTTVVTNSSAWVTVWIPGGTILSRYPSRLINRALMDAIQWRPTNDPRNP